MTVYIILYDLDDLDLEKELRYVFKKFDHHVSQMKYSQKKNLNGKQNSLYVDQFRY